MDHRLHRFQYRLGTDFHHYAAAYDLANLLGHYLKILSFWCIYKALIETGLRKPYALFFRDLKQSEEQLEIRVRERTAELTRAKETVADHHRQYPRYDLAFLVLTGMSGS